MELGTGGVGGFGLHLLVGGRMLDLAAGGEPDEFGLAGDGGGDALAFVLELAEKCGELIEIFLAPLFVGMMMAAGAFETDAEKDLAEKRADFAGFAAVAEEDDRAAFGGAALGEKNFAGELVVG